MNTHLNEHNEHNEVDGSILPRQEHYCTSSTIKKSPTHICEEGGRNDRVGNAQKGNRSVSSRGRKAPMEQATVHAHPIHTVYLYVERVDRRL